MISFVAAVAAIGLLGNVHVTGLDGHVHEPLVEAKGKATAFLFISHDCPICNAYAPEFKRIARQFGPKGIRVELVYSEPSFSLKAAEAHFKAYGYGSIPAFLDPHGLLAHAAGATITPEAAVYDSRGVLKYLGRIDDQYAALGRQRARITSRDLRVALNDIVAGKPILNPRTPAVGCYIAFES